MPGGLTSGPQLKQALIQAAPLFSSMAAGYSSGRGPYAYLDQGIAGMQAAMKAKRDEEAAAAANAAFAGLVPGGMGSPRRSGPPVATATRDPMDPTSISGDAMAALGKDSGTAGYRASLIGTESGGNWKAQNNEIGAGGKAGHFGRVQFGQERLQEAMNAGAIPQGTTPEQFMNSPALQIAAENWHFADLERQLGDLVGREVNGKVMDLPALVAMGHLGGAGGARKYVETGGAYNPSDAYGTSLADYAETHGGSGSAVPSVADPMADPYVQQLMSVMAMPGLTPEQKSVVEMQLQSRLSVIAPQPGETVPSGFRELELQAQAAGLQPGTPEYQQFMLSGGGLGTSRPAAFEALHLQAIAAGFQEGSPEYQEFMATRGAGLVAESKAMGEAAGTAAASAPSAALTASQVADQIEDLKNDPDLWRRLGPIDSRMPVITEEGARVQSKIDQLQGGAFLQARELLKGGGQITDYEGKKAEAAFVRMNQAQSEADFKAALDEFNRAVQDGLAKLEAQAGIAPVTTVPSGNLGLSDDDLKYLESP